MPTHLHTTIMWATLSALSRLRGKMQQSIEKHCPAHKICAIYLVNSSSRHLHPPNTKWSWAVKLNYTKLKWQ